MRKKGAGPGRGGLRHGAGRKSDSDLAAIRALIDACVSDEDWKKAIVALAKQAARGQWRAFATLAAYRFGSPKQEIKLDDVERVSVNIYLPGLDDVAAAPGATNAVPPEHGV